METVNRTFYLISNRLYEFKIDFFLESYSLAEINLQKSDENNKYFKTEGKYDLFNDLNIPSEEEMKSDNITQEDIVAGVECMIEDILSFKFDNADVKCFDVYQNAINVAKRNLVVKNKYTFDDIILNKEVEEEIKQVIDFIKQSERYKKIGVRPIKGLIMHGSEGNGKTLVSKIIASESGKEYIYKSGSAFVNKYAGTGAANVRKLFDSARSSKAIVIIDEIDGLIGRRAGEDNNERDVTVNEFLSQMDGFSDNDDIFVIGMTNRLDLLDDAAIRSGRFDKKIEINKPDIISREKMFRLYADRLIHEENIDYKLLAELTEGVNGADISTICNEAGIRAVKEDRNIVLMKDLEYTIKKIKVNKNKNVSIGFAI